jgi:hypothetical protein
VVSEGPSAPEILTQPAKVFDPRPAQGSCEQALADRIDLIPKDFCEENKNILFQERGSFYIHIMAAYLNDCHSRGRTGRFPNWEIGLMCKTFDDDQRAWCVARKVNEVYSGEVCLTDDKMVIRNDYYE